ncbi:hypothetical protein QBC32DRAFT_352912 [Pseudoneurospora amorphoporcata]|uniref:Uncharacterized protein n=1 Tax=Pseudoneurospora amorphoporcata TaxID=241081 RepID=A0AAN6SBV2_9PEZI|nr:hypothetical protein QBC32DRAFT_352912 [Pseudoneurospora amorphoporcata]
MGSDDQDISEDAASDEGAGEDSASDGNQTISSDSAGPDKNIGVSFVGTNENNGEDSMELGEDPSRNSNHPPRDACKEDSIATDKNISENSITPDWNQIFAKLTMMSGLKVFFRAVKGLRSEQAGNQSLLPMFQQPLPDDEFCCFSHYDDLRKLATGNADFALLLDFLSLYEVYRILYSDGDRDRARSDILDMMSTDPQQRRKFSRDANYARRVFSCVLDHRGLVCFLPRSSGGEIPKKIIETVIEPSKVDQYLREIYGDKKLSVLDEIGKEFMASVWKGKEFRQREFEKFSDAELAEMEFDELFSHLGKI